MKVLLRKFLYALNGMVYTIKTELNMKIHLTISCVVILFGIYQGLEPWEWAVLVLAIGLVLITETINTALESAVDIYCDTYHPLAKLTKDIAAGAVLISAIIAAILGVVIFIF